MTKLLDTSRTLIDTSTMKGVSTAQAAKRVGVTTRTLFRWLDSGLLPEPRRIKMPGQLWRLWSAKDIARARELKAQTKRGPKPKSKKKA
jgi:DNA-binding transcriptional MerR regulator